MMNAFTQRPVLGGPVFFFFFLTAKHQKNFFKKMIICFHFSDEIKSLGHTAQILEHPMRIKGMRVVYNSRFLTVTRWQTF